MESYDLTLSEYWRIIRKRQWTIIFVFILIMISTFVFTKMQTPVYEAVLELKIEKQHPMVSVSSGGDGASIDLPSGASTLATEMRLIKSLPVMEKVVERMEVLPSDREERQKVLHALSLSYQNRVTVEQIHDTNILNIRVSSSDPQKAALMAMAIADVYIVENVEGRKRQSKAMIEYIDKQLVDYKQQLSVQESELQKFKQNEKVFEVTPEIKETLNRMTIEGTFEFESEMLAIDAQLKKLDSSLSERTQSKILQFVNTTSISDNYIFTGLKRRLLEHEFDRFLLLIDYTEKHPSVTQKDQVISQMKNKMVNMIKDYSNVSIDPKAEEDLSLVIKKLFLENRREVLFRIVNKFYEESGSLSSNQLEYLGLKRNIDRLLNSYDLLLRQKDEVKLNLAKVIDDVVTVVSPAKPPSRPIKPNAKINYLVSCAVGLLLGFMVGFIKESVDSSVSTIHDVEHDIKLSILGIIPHMRKDEVLALVDEDAEEKDKKLLMQRARLVTISNPKSWSAESIKMLRTNLIQLMKTQNLKTILFTSSDKQEGKTTTDTNIAISMAQLGKKTVFVGANMRRPSAFRIFGLQREPGLSDILMGNISWQDAIRNSVDILTGGIDVDSLLAFPGIDNLKMITAGRPVDNISELLNSTAFDQLMTDLKNNFDIVIIDCSPVMAVPDAITMCSRVDGVALVYNVGHTPKDVLNMAKNNLIKANANLLGVILNNIKTEAQVGYSAFSYRYYGEGKDPSKKQVKIFKENKGQEAKSS